MISVSDVERQPIAPWRGRGSADSYVSYFQAAVVTQERSDLREPMLQASARVKRSRWWWGVRLHRVRDRLAPLGGLTNGDSHSHYLVSAVARLPPSRCLRPPVLRRNGDRNGADRPRR